ncbi:MAG: sigma 54-interacting transcriptional regulator, partial [Planifilum fimeticola]
MEVGKMAKSAPFVTFNCADYANNPQLLLGQLFGVKRGAFTGAREQRGLLEIADGGVLFLDEVHRLPGEGQEMLFTFIDKGCFRRLGETEAERNARVLLIAATTENPGSKLLKTFTRRIPMVIELPPLRERSLEERYRLILGFFKEEAIRLGREIYVSPDVIRALLYYRCPNNVGQLKVDIQLNNTRGDEVSLHEGLYVFHPAEREEMFAIAHQEAEQTVYEKIEKRYNELKARGVDDDELDWLMEIDIENYFTYYLKRVSRRVKVGGPVKIVRPEILKLAEEILNYAGEKLCRKFDAEVLQSLALHIQASADRIKKGGKIVNPHLNQVRRKYKAAFVTAVDCLKKIEDRLNIDLPIDEAGFLTMFFVLDPSESKDAEESVQILVLAHGDGIATAMAGVANQLLGTRYASGVDIPLAMSPKEAFERVKESIQPTASGVLLLADMGSLVRFDEMLEDELNIPAKAIPMVSTLHVLEATRKAMLG